MEDGGPDSSPNRRRTRQDDTSPNNTTNGSRKRRAFLQTMGQQLREFGPEGTSPHNVERNSLTGASPTPPHDPRTASTAAESGRVGTTTIIQPVGDSAPGEDDQVPAGADAASNWLWRDGEALMQSAEGDTIHSTFEQLLGWSQSYFDNWHPAFPFLQAPVLLDYFRQISQHGERRVPDPSSFLHTILRSVLSISLLDRRQMRLVDGGVPSQFLFRSFNDAISSTHRVLTEESSIMSLQALISVQLFLISMLRYNAASRLQGLTIRMLFQLGLHRCPILQNGLTHEQALVRKRLFWSVFCIDRYVCIRLGTPLGIRLDDTDVCYAHSEIHDDTNEPERASPKGSRHTWQFMESLPQRDERLDLLEFLSRHASIRGSIMELRNKSTMNTSFDETEPIIAIESEHLKWWNHCEEYLASSDQSQNIAKFHQVTLIVLRFESVIALYRSVLASSQKGSTYNAALQRCLTASRSVINTLHKAMHGYGAFDGSPGQKGYERIPLIWPSFTWAVWISAFIVVFASSEGQIPMTVATRLAGRSIEILKHLTLRGTSWPEACIVAVQNLIARLHNGTQESSRRNSITASDPNSRTTHHRDSQQPAQQKRRPLNANLNYEGRAPDGVATVPTVLPGPYGHAARQLTPLPPSTNLDAFNFQNTLYHPHITSGSQQHATNPFSSGHNFLGIAQQLSDNPITNDEIVNMFNHEDIASWMVNDFGFGGYM